MGLATIQKGSTCGKYRNATVLDPYKTEPETAWNGHSWYETGTWTPPEVVLQCRCGHIWSIPRSSFRISLVTDCGRTEECKFARMRVDVEQYKVAAGQSLLEMRYARLVEQQNPKPKLENGRLGGKEDSRAYPNLGWESEDPPDWATDGVGERTCVRTRSWLGDLQAKRLSYRAPTGLAGSPSINPALYDPEIERMDSRGSGRPSLFGSRMEPIRVVMPDTVRAWITGKARAMNMSVSEWMRSIIMGAEIPKDCPDWDPGGSQIVFMLPGKVADALRKKADDEGIGVTVLVRSALRGKRKLRRESDAAPDGGDL